MTLNPTASLANYAIDFIDVTGTTTLSLSSDNASTTPLTWTVPDKPWSDGDLLMLRIHKPVSNDATLSALALSGVDITFSTATTTYTASVPATTTQTTVTPTANHDAATYVVKLGGVVDDDGTIPLAAGANVITIDVTAEDAVTTQDLLRHRNSRHPIGASHRDAHTTCRRPHLLRHRHPMELLRLVRKLLGGDHHRHQLSDIVPGLPPTGNVLPLCGGRLALR